MAKSEALATLLTLIVQKKIFKKGKAERVYASRLVSLKLAIMWFRLFSIIDQVIDFCLP